MSTHQDAYNKGFTLVETLVALTLLTVGLIPAFVQATSALALSTTIRNSVIAADLAQEGVEVVRAMRDANWFANQPFDTGLTTCTTGCLVKWDSSSPQSSGGSVPLRFDSVTGLYQYDTGSDTPFSRTVTITAVSAVELLVKSTVTWRERSIDKQFVVEEHLFDWIQ
jgi:prepilin-type N-terminal cleavage/methylation domain-containing protein